MNQSSLLYDSEFESERGGICSPGYRQHLKINNKAALDGPIWELPLFYSVLSIPK